MREYILYELAMANVVIVSPKSYISEHSRKELNIITYKDKILWTQIFEYINIINIRDNLIEKNYSWKDGVGEIINTLTNYKLTKKIIKKKTRREKIIDKRNELKNLKELNKKINTKKINKPKKRPILLQSRLRI